jgi:hypothetical protein
MNVVPRTSGNSCCGIETISPSLYRGILQARALTITSKEVTSVLNCQLIESHPVRYVGR